MSDTVVSKVYRILRDSSSSAWDKISFWTKAVDVEAADGKTLETKIGAIDGVTSDVSSESTKYAASIKSVHDLNSNLTANSQPFRFGYQDGKYGYIVESEGADTFNPFSSGSVIEGLDNTYAIMNRFWIDGVITDQWKISGFEGIKYRLYCYSGNRQVLLYVDDVLICNAAQGSPVTGEYTFENTGEHIIKMTAYYPGSGLSSSGNIRPSGFTPF